MKLRNRTLLTNGVSILSNEEMFERILNGLDDRDFDFLKVEKSEDAEVFEMLYQVNMIYDGENPDITPEILSVGNEEELIGYLLNNRRDNTPLESHNDRIDKELEFFFSNEVYVKFLFTLRNLIKKFKDNNVVWGVGRGSSCASYILFLLEVHDINPITYDIDFKEFSKE